MYNGNLPAIEPKRIWKNQQQRTCVNLIRQIIEKLYKNFFEYQTLLALMTGVLFLVILHQNHLYGPVKGLQKSKTNLYYSLVLSLVQRKHQILNQLYKQLMQLLAIGVDILLKMIKKEQVPEKSRFGNIHIKLIARHITVLVLGIKVHQSFHHTGRKQIMIFRNSLTLWDRKIVLWPDYYSARCLDHV